MSIYYVPRTIRKRHGFINKRVCDYGKDTPRSMVPNPGPWGHLSASADIFDF